MQPARPALGFSAERSLMNIDYDAEHSRRAFKTLPAVPTESRYPRSVIQMPPPLQRPGSPEAIAIGCTCNPIRNKHGEGIKRGGRLSFLCDEACPIHGAEVVRKAIQQGQARIARGQGQKVH